MSRREIGISQSNISFSFWRVIRLYDFVSFFGFLMFWCFSSSYNTYTILMELNFLTESSLYAVYLRFTGKKHRPLDSIRIVFCTREICLAHHLIVFWRNCLFRKTPSFAPFQRVDVSLYVITRLSLQS